MNPSEFIENISSNPWLSIISLVLTAMGIFLSIWFYRKGDKKKKPTYCSRTINLVKDSISKVKHVEILFKGAKIENLSTTEIAVWNAGKETISFSDVAQNDRFRIELEGDGKILEFEIIYLNNTANDFKLKKVNEKRIEIIFDYFDYNEGFIVRVYHTATTDLLKVTGAFKGTKYVSINHFMVRENFFDKFLSLKISPKTMRILLGVFLVITPVLFILDAFTPEIFSPDSIQKIRKALYVFQYPVMIYFALLFWYMGYRVLKRRVPKDFKLFEKEF
uniref:hypothetical protein n=1 Tax=Alistipes sp. D31t1_170403_E11 TaxID=2787128 RepID=UPI001898E21B|nr:hypothetical protein [Alistipes sp. D31t1_170403_E11]